MVGDSESEKKCLELHHKWPCSTTSHCSSSCSTHLRLNHWLPHGAGEQFAPQVIARGSHRLMFHISSRSTRCCHGVTWYVVDMVSLVALQVVACLVVCLVAASRLSSKKHSSNNHNSSSSSSNRSQPLQQPELAHRATQSSPHTGCCRRAAPMTCGSMRCTLWWR